MLHIIGSTRELSTLPSTVPPGVIAEISRSTTALDREYGADRDYYTVGGFTVIADTSDDLPGVVPIIDYNTHPPEWVHKLDSYAAALYVLNDDFTIELFIPLSEAPDTILKELEDDLK